MDVVHLVISVKDAERVEESTTLHDARWPDQRNRIGIGVFLSLSNG